MKKKSFYNYALVCALSVITLISCKDDDTQNTDQEIENEDNKLPTGSSANDILSSDTFTSLRLELAYVEGYRPQQSTIDNIEGFLNDRLNKPNGIAIVETLIEDTGENGPYNINEIVEIEENFRTVYNNGDELGIYIFFSDEQSSSNSGNGVVLGTAYRNTSMVIYERTFIELANNSITPINRSLIETSTLRHEFGHLFGLVNLGTPDVSLHEDTANPKHCNVEDCLMYFQTVTTVFNTSNVANLPDFDTLCIEDLQANGGK